MANPYLAEIKMFGGNFAPQGFAFCNGQILSIQQNTALFSLLGTTYGGNGTTTFALPDLRGRVPLHWGQGPGLSSYVIGEIAGTESVTLLSTQIPQHNHALNVSNAPGTDGVPANNMVLAASTARDKVYSTSAPNATLSPTTAIGMTGGSQPHSNIQPFLAVSLIIALQGIFPARN
jgi:microcystin-dependent protein